MLRNTSIFSIKLFAAILIFGIGALAQANGLGSAQWKLARVYGQAAANLNASIAFDSAEKRFTGNSGCNRMFGSYEESDKGLKFFGIGTTRMMCQEAEMKTETSFLKALREATSFKQKGNSLRIYAGKRLILRFNAAYKQNAASEPAAAANLQGKKWVLESIEGRPASMLESEAFINFNKEKGSAGGNTSCNVFGANYTAEGNKLKITQVISTMRACVEDDRMNIERGFLDALRETDRFEIRSGKLFLYRGETLLLTFTFKGENK